MSYSIILSCFFFVHWSFLCVHLPTLLSALEYTVSWTAGVHVVLRTSNVSLFMQCSFLPKFQIHIETRYENNSGTSDNVSSFETLLALTSLNAI